MSRVLIEFTHGLGDAVQFTAVLKHLRKYRPDWRVHAVGLPGKESAWYGLCEGAFANGPPFPPGEYDQRYDLGWYENYCGYADRPNSKITNCLAEVFGIPYDPALGRYEIHPGAAARKAAEKWLRRHGFEPDSAGKVKAVCVHYQGNTSPEKKNIPDGAAATLVEFCLAAGRRVILLDWDGRSPLPDGKRVVCPGASDELWGGGGTGDAGRIAALVGACEAYFGIDSGPGKVASATDTPTVITWTGHHPIQFHDPAPNTTHLVPRDHRKVPPAGNPALAAYFERHYLWSGYEPGLLPAALCEEAGRILGWTAPREEGLVQIGGFWTLEGKEAQTLEIVGDVYRRDAYKTRLRPPAPEDGEEFVLDVGANVGTFARLWAERNPDAKVACVEVMPEIVPALRRNAPAATVFGAACRYAAEPLYLLDAVSGGVLSKSVGGSRVVGRAEWERETDPQYVKRDSLPVPTVTLESLRRQLGWPRIDVLKLDCEGSEFDILENCDLRRVGTIFAESHGREKWADLLRRRFGGWDIGHMSQTGEFGLWHLVNPRDPRLLYPDQPAWEEAGADPPAKLAVLVCGAAESGAGLVARILLAAGLADDRPSVKGTQISEVPAGGGPVCWRVAPAEVGVAAARLARAGYSVRPVLVTREAAAAAGAGAAADPMTAARETQAAHRTFWAEVGEYPCEVLPYEALALHPRAVVAGLYARLGLGRPRRHETVRDDNARHYPMGG